MVQAIRAESFSTENGGSLLGDAIWRFSDNSTSLKRHWVLRDQKFDSFLLAIFREINETVLPREITLSTDVNVVVRLLVASRRLLSIEIDDDSEQPCETETGETETGETETGETETGDAETGDTETGNIENVAQVYTNRLHSVIKRSSEIHIRITARGLVSSSNRKSCSAHSLAASVGLSLRAAEPSENINEFFLGAEKLASASVRYQRNSNQTEKRGDDSLTDLLMTVAARNYSNARKSGPSAGITAAKPFCSVFRLNDTLNVIVAHDRDEKVLFIIPPNKVSVAMALWQKVFATAS